MQDSEDRSSFETMGSIMAELKADAKTLSGDLLDGIGTYEQLATTNLALGILVGIIAVVLYASAVLPQGLVSTYLIVVLLIVAIVAVLQGYASYRRYSLLRRKYSSLESIWSEIGE
jgi:hypothetical protein